MTRRPKRLAIAAAMLALTAGGARASASAPDAATAAVFAQEFGALAITDLPVAAPLLEPAVSVMTPAVTTAIGWVPKPRPRASGAVRYEPRRQSPPPGHPPVPQGFANLYGGMLDPEGIPAARFIGGFRAGAAPDPHLRLGALVEWSHQQTDAGTLTSTTPGPGGIPIVSEIDVQSSTFDLVPFMAFAEVSLMPKRFVSPYVGIAGGGEWLHLTASDINIPVGFEADYTGWGWQSWAGVALSLGLRARLTGEVFMNQATVSRNAWDPMLGYEVRESVNVDGGGFRAGLAWGF